MSLGIECLLTDDLGRAAEIASQLDNINRERRAIENDMQEVAMQTLENINPQSSATLCLFNDQWHQGVIGIVASRLKEKYFRPTITFAPAGNGMIKGSGRSIPGFHLRDALDLVSKRAPHLIDKFGGHAMAAGLSLQEKDFEEFLSTFEQVGKEWLTSSQLEHVLETDGELDISDFNLDFISLLETQVWGQGFAPPVFNDQFQVLNQKILKEKHLKLFLEKDGQQFDAIWFNHTEGLPKLIRVAYRLDANEYNGRTKVQLLLEYAEAV
jgi:single-stranded-DNA-specific exonuclease